MVKERPPAAMADRRGIGCMTITLEESTARLLYTKKLAMSNQHIGSDSMNGIIKSNAVKSPCLTCTRVKDPRNCENKLCKDWQNWFVERWDAMRASIYAGTVPLAVDRNAITVGGYQYSHPDHVRQFLRYKPCLTCNCPEDLCKEPCTLLVVWEAMKEKAVKE